MESIILLPLGFLGGIFYSVRQLPAVWDVVSQINPVFWLVQVERIGLLGRGDVSAVSALAAVWGLAVALSVWSAVIFGRNRLKA
jgi:ABC-2 type transport system permease protein